MCQPEFTVVGGGCWLLAWCRAVPELSAKRYSERRHLALLGDATGKFYQSGDSGGLAMVLTMPGSLVAMRAHQ